MSSLFGLPVFIGKHPHQRVYHMSYFPVHAAMICFYIASLVTTSHRLKQGFMNPSQALYTLMRKLNRESPHIKMRCLGIFCKLAFDMIMDSKQVVVQSQTNFPLSLLICLDSTVAVFEMEILFFTSHSRNTLQHFTWLNWKMKNKKTKDKQANLQMVWKVYCGKVHFVRI